ncbi:MAG: DUF1254 domain-containing protein [Colwellia sp.]
MVKFKQTLWALSLSIFLPACTPSADNKTAKASSAVEQTLTEQANSKYAAQYEEGVLASIQTPNTVETSIGTLQFIDGSPTKATAKLVYDSLDRQRGIDVFLKGIPAASLRALMNGARSIGAQQAHQVMIMDKLLDSKSLFLTGNTSTLYALPQFDLERDGPTVVEVPPGMLGAFDDAWFRFLENIGPLGPDRGKGGKFLLVPPGYQGELPEGYFLVKSRTNKVWSFMRASIANGLTAGVKNIKDNLKIYPLAKINNQPAMEYVSGSGKYFNSIHPNDFSFYGHLNHVIQEEPLGMIDSETRGLLASIGIEKGKEFAPDGRMKKILIDAVAIANATARSIVWYPRTESTMSGVEIYPETKSSWIMAWNNKNVFYTTETGGMNSDVRVMFHYPYTAVTPAMAVTIPGKGSDYAIAYLDGNKQPFDGNKFYQVTIPANVPVADFWAITIYDTQTRSLLQTSQAYPSVGSQTKDLRANEDGSYTLYFGPKAPKGFEKNWLETIPGKSWFTALRMYGPEQDWIDKKWRISDIYQYSGHGDFKKNKQGLAVD